MHGTFREQDPPRPSTRVTAAGATTGGVAKHRQTSAVGLGKELRGDLDAITLKAMEKDRTRRYASASEFAADIERYLEGDAVLARPASVMYRTRKFVRRHKVGVAAAALVGVAVLAGLVVATAFYFRAEKARQEADSQRAEAQRQAYVATISAVDLDLRAGESTDARRRLHEVPKALRAFASPDTGTRPRARSSYLAVAPGATAVVASRTSFFDQNAKDHTLQVLDPASGRLLATFRGHTGGVLCAAFSPNGRHLASTGDDRVVRVWDLATGRLLAALTGGRSEPAGLAFSADGTRLFAALVSGQLCAWSVDATGARRRR